MPNFSKPVRAFINDHSRELLDRIDRQLIVSIIELMGGEDGFLDNYRDIAQNANSESFGFFDGAAEVNEFYVDHQEIIINHCADTAGNFGLSSALEVVTRFSEGRGYNPDEIANALFGAHHQDEDTAPHIQASIRNIAICYCINSICNGYVTMLDDSNKYKI